MNLKKCTVKKQIICIITFFKSIFSYVKYKNSYLKHNKLNIQDNFRVSKLTLNNNKCCFYITSAICID